MTETTDPDPPVSFTNTRQQAIQLLAPATTKVLMSSFTPVTTPRAKNLVFLMLDDSLPWPTHLGLYNLSVDPVATNLFPQTPNIAALLAKGKLFFNVTGSPVCSPTRAQIISGLKPHLSGVGGIVSEINAGTLVEFRDAAFQHGVPPLFEVLRDRGVYTGYVGKSHLSLPLGADTNPPTGHSGIGFGVLERMGSPDWTRMTLRNLNQSSFVGQVTFGLSYTNWWHYDAQTDVLSNRTEHATDVQTDDAIEFVQTAAGRPFYLQWWLCAPHAPYNWPGDENALTQEYIDQRPLFNGGLGTQFLNQAAMVEHVDSSIGRFMAAMDPAELAQTLFVVCNDNGFDKTAMLSAINDHGKSWGAAWDGLIADPDGRFKNGMFRWSSNMQLLVAGPGVTHETSHVLVDATDFYTTIAAYFDAETVTHEGVSFLPAITGHLEPDAHARQASTSDNFSPTGDPGLATTRRRRAAKWRADGLWALVRPDAADVVATEQLYHLYDGDIAAVDPDELTDVAGANPAILAELQAVLTAEDAFTV